MPSHAKPRLSRPVMDGLPLLLWCRVALALYLLRLYRLLGILVPRFFVHGPQKAETSDIMAACYHPHVRMHPARPLIAAWSYDSRPASAIPSPSHADGPRAKRS